MDDRILWYTTRGAGAVSLVLLSAVVGLGLLTRARVESRGWPRFLIATLHRDLALIALAFLALHIVTAAVDPFTHLGLTAVAVPFGSAYRTVWLGFGTVALELLIAVVVTSLLRGLIGVRAWRAVHWLSVAAWPVAVLHGLGTGTDAFSRWMLAITAGCVAGVAAAGALRLGAGGGDRLGAERRAAAAASAGRGR